MNLLFHVHIPGNRSAKIDYARLTPKVYCYYCVGSSSIGIRAFNLFYVQMREICCLLAYFKSNLYHTLYYIIYIY